jgi:hypothetical protein
MPNPSGPDRDQKSNAPGFDPDNVDRGAATDPAESDAETTEHVAASDDNPTESYRTEPAPEVFDAGHPSSESTKARPRTAMPQLIPPRLGAKLRPTNQRSWGWVLALILIILALAAVAVLGTVLLTRHDKKPTASQEDRVRSTIQSFDVAVQNGDLSTLRGITCGNMRDDYVNYDEREWNDTYHRVAAAKQYPVVANIDQVVVNGNHAEANVTAFMAYAPQVRSTRSFDLQYRDNQWKICEATTG